MRAVSAACFSITERMSSVERGGWGCIAGSMVMREVEGDRLWCKICDSAAN